jgi:signal transduction histidine kinase
MIAVVRRREALSVAGAALLLALLVAGGVGFEIWRMRADALSEARLRGANLSRVLEEQTRSAVRAVDLSLLGIVDALRLEPATPAHEEIFTRRLRARVAQLPYVRALFVVGADGYIVQDSDRDTPRRSLADRDYFRAHAEGAQRGLFIGRPLVSRSAAAPWFLSMSRPITLDDGSFYGVAVAALEPHYFARFYAAIEVGEGGSVSLIHRDGLMVARYPDHERAVGASFADSALFRDHLPESPTGSYRTASAIDGIERIFNYRSLDPLPLIVVVGVSEEAALENWRRNAAIAGAATLGFVAVLAAGTLVLIRQREREAVAAERLRQIEKSEALGQITSSVAHDFNNLLTIILGNLEVAARRLPEDDRLRRSVENAMSATDRGARLVRQLLAFARRRPELATVENPKDLLLASQDLLRQAAGPAGLSVDCAAPAWDCELDRSAFERAMMNLVVNARDARPRTPVRIAVRNVPRAELDRGAWAELEPGDYVACRVADDGAGMPPEIVERACQPFFTTKAEGKGTGLGLSQAYGFARQSGGSLRIESAPGTGTRVTLLLPRARPRRGGAGSAASAG